jgi:hypothetical protein
VFAVSRTWQQPVTTARDDGKKYTEEQFQQALREQVEQIAKSSDVKPDTVVTPDDAVQPRVQVITRRTRSKNQPSNRLTRDEREQLAADLGLIPGREEELPFVLPEGEEPNQ